MASDGFAAESARRAAFDLLRRVPPRLETAKPRANPLSLFPREDGAAPEDAVALENLVAPEETPLDAVRRIAPRLDRSVLPVQGPPGSGKTYTGARMILDLLADGKRVGVTANSHKVISNLLGAVCRAMDERPGEGARPGREQGGVAAGPAAVDVRGIQKANDGDGCSDERIVQTHSNETVAEALSNGDANLAGGTAWHTVIGPGPLAGHGLRFIPVEHAGNTNASTEEADRVAALVGELLDAGAASIDKEGRRKPLMLRDILVVAPYNAHVATLRAALPDGARVGTVDMFQGQEAPIAIYSMATSTADEAPRGMAFLYSLHRLNVATSRARCVAAIVASRALLTPDCRTPEQMRLANPLCRFLELAEATPSAP